MYRGMLSKYTRTPKYAKRSASRQKGSAYKRFKQILPAVASFNRRGVASRETGFVDLALANYAMDTTGTITLIATIAQGSSVNQRVGKKAQYKSVQVRGNVVQGTAAAFNDCAMLLVYDRRPTGALPAITDVLVASTASSFNNDANSGRFKIVRRWDFGLVGNLTGVIATQQATESSGLSADAYVKLPLPVIFKAAGTGAIGDIEEGALYLITVGNNAAGTTAAIAQLAFRVRFMDVF